MSADEKSVALNLLGHKEFRLRHRNLGALWKPAKTATPPKSVTNRIFRSPPVPWITLPAFGLSRISSSRAARASSASEWWSQALVKVAIWTKIRCRSATSIVTPVAHSPSNRCHTTTYY